METEVVASPVLQLQPEPSAPDRLQVSYLKRYADYVPVYGKQVRTIKWWVARGQEAKDLPPLDAPMEMPDWWSRVMTQGCPKSVLEAARVVAAGPVVQPVTAAVESGMAEPARQRVPYVAPQITSQEQNLEELKAQLAHARQALLEAQTEDPQDPARVESRQRKWRELRTEVDEAEAVVFKMRKLQGQLVDLAQVEATLVPMLANLHSAIRSTCTRLRPSLAAAKTDAEQEVIWQRGVDEAFEELVKTGFMKEEALAA